MASGTFTGPAEGAYSFDHGRKAFYEKQDAERRAKELAERAARWIAGKMAGQEFTSLADLHHAASDLVTEVTDEQATAIRQGCVLIWLGQCDRDLGYRRCVERSGDTLTFLAAS